MRVSRAAMAGQGDYVGAGDEEGASSDDFDYESMTASEVLEKLEEVGEISGCTDTYKGLKDR